MKIVFLFSKYIKARKEIFTNKIEIYLLNSNNIKEQFEAVKICPIESLVFHCAPLLNILLQVLNNQNHPAVKIARDSL